MSGPDSNTETLVVDNGSEKPDGEKLQKVLARMGYGLAGSSRRALPRAR